MGHKTRIMYIERKAGSLTGSARIGRVTYSKTGATIYYRGKEFRSIKGSGFKANYYEVGLAKSIGFQVLEKMVSMRSILQISQHTSMRMSAKNTGHV